MRALHQRSQSNTPIKKKKPQPIPPFVGLANEGGHASLNAVMQVVANTELCDYFLDTEARALSIKKFHPNNQLFMSELRKVVSGMKGRRTLYRCDVLRLHQQMVTTTKGKLMKG